MPNIQVLAPHVADLIAAGEVVERPASVAKELMENAIDAGASTVTVEISHGGLTFLRVTDDGKGIPATELKTAFLRHATSKLRTEYDLEAIGTLGFRGEALAAISAVSRMEVMSRTQEAPLGAGLRLEGGVPGEVEEAGCPLGTTMVVRDLFFNTPARLKFMKKDAAEGAAVFAAVQRTALSHPEVSVKFIRDGKQELLTPGDGQLKSAVYAVLGRELALGFREVRASGEEMTVTGFVSMPACCRGSRNWQFFFVNGRQVKSRLMAAALEEAYKNQRMVGKFPGCVLHLETKLNAVDVNVHPAKTEVKFGSERTVFSAVYHAVLSTLEGDKSHPSLELRNESIPGVVPTPPPAPVQTRLNLPQTSMPVRDAAAWKQESRQTSPAPERKEESSPVRPPEPLPALEPEPVQTRLPGPESIQESLPHSEPGPEPLQEPLPHPEPGPEPLLHPEPVQESLPHPEPDPEPEFPGWRVAGELFRTYILVEQGEEMLLIDKHAAHERMNFDRMKAEGYTPMAQRLLTPVTCRLSAQEQEVLLARQELLEEFGFDVDELGGKLAVRQAPDYLDTGDIPATLEEIAQKLLTTGNADPSAARDDLLHTMACKAAIKGGWRSGPQELERVARAVMSGQVRYCPHGRPVAVRLTQKELEKQFKRA